MDDETLELQDEANVQKSHDLTRMIHKEWLQSIINDLQLLMDDDDWFSYDVIADSICEHLTFQHSDALAYALLKEKPLLESGTIRTLCSLADGHDSVDAFVNKLLYHYETTKNKD